VDRCGSNIGSETRPAPSEPRGFASPPHGGFAFVGLFDLVRYAMPVWIPGLGAIVLFAAGSMSLASMSAQEEAGGPRRTTHGSI
jgi:hypothetical protein